MKTAKEAKDLANETNQKRIEDSYRLCLDKLSSLIDNESISGNSHVIINYQWDKEIYQNLHYCYPEVKKYCQELGYTFEKDVKTGTYGAGPTLEYNYILSWENAK